MNNPFVIAGEMDGGERLYWNNEHGWVDRASATVFQADEWDAICDPIGATGRENAEP